jgi:hypothetical protein
MDLFLYDDITESETEEEFLIRKAINRGNNYMFFFKNKDGMMKLRYHHPLPEGSFKEGVLDVEEMVDGTYKIVNIPTTM